MIQILLVGFRTVCEHPLNLARHPVGEQSTRNYNFSKEKNRVLLASCWYHQDNKPPCWWIKGKVTRDFLLQVVFMNHLPKAPGVVDTGGEFAIGVDDTGGKSPGWRPKKRQLKRKKIRYQLIG